MVDNMNFGTPKAETGAEMGFFSSVEGMKQTLDNLKDNANKLGSLGKLPAYEKEVKDLNLAIANLEARIGEDKN